MFKNKYGWNELADYIWVDQPVYVWSSSSRLETHMISVLSGLQPQTAQALVRDTISFSSGIVAQQIIQSRTRSRSQWTL